MTGLQFHKAYEIVVDVDVPFHVVIHLIFLADLDFLDKPDKGGTVKFLKLGVVLYHVQPIVNRLLVCLAGRQLCGDVLFVFQLLRPFRFVLVQKLDTDTLRDTSHNLILIGGLNQLFKFGKTFIQCGQLCFQSVRPFCVSRFFLSEYPLFKGFAALLGEGTLCSEYRSAPQIPELSR